MAVAIDPVAELHEYLQDALDWRYALPKLAEHLECVTTPEQAVTALEAYVAQREAFVEMLRADDPGFRKILRHGNMLTNDHTIKVIANVKKRYGLA